jgi:hypothetical protein
MSRVRTFLFLVFLSGIYFVYIRIQESISEHSSVLSFLPLLTLLLSLLTLVISPRALALYTASVVSIALCVGIYEILVLDVGATSRFLSISEVALFSTGLLWLRSQLKNLQWVKVQRYSKSQESPWVLLDQGKDPTLEFGKEEK